MSYQVLARKWRPQKLQDVVGQEHIINSLQNALIEERFGHAYIFSGTRGIGKTSVARIFARSIRCLNRQEDGNYCGKCESCLDINTNSSMNIIEIDGASNNSVDDIRELISNVYYVPTIGKYKVYIIDEVHMLSASAFNALLKTLEEPPAHAIFLLATTEPEKLLGTVLSRCQRFDFRNAEVKDLVYQIKKIAQAEQISFENENLITELAKLGSGSFRDTLSLMDQVLSFCAGKNITEEIFSKSLGLAKVSTLKTIIDSMIAGDVVSLSSAYRSALFENVPAKAIVKSTLETLFSIIMAKDFDDYKRVQNKISQSSFDMVSKDEIYWIYEVLTSDFKWALESICQEDAIEVVLRKISLRKEFFSSSLKEGPKTDVVKSEEFQAQATATASSHADQDEAKKKTELTPELSPELSTEFSQELPGPSSHAISISEILHNQLNDIPHPVHLNESVSDELVRDESVNKESNSVVNDSQNVSQDVVSDEVESIEKNWDNFLDFLRNYAPSSSANLEQGNLISPISISENQLIVELGFPKSAKVFHDYLNEPEANHKLIGFLEEFFKVERSKINFKIEIVDGQDSNIEFHSKAELKAIEEDKKSKEQEDKLANNPVIKHAEKIFGSKVDRINLNNKK